MVPLALSLPGGPPEAGEEVVLAAGSSEGAELAGSADVPLAEVDVESETEVAVGAQSVGGDATSSEPPVKRRQSGARATSRSSSTSGRSWVAALTGKKATPATTRRTATPTEATAEAATVAKPVAAVATPPPSATSPKSPPPPKSPAPPSTPPSPPAASARRADDVWDRLAQCESGNTNDHEAPYYGYWQFSAGTWSSLGEPGLPDEHSRERQLAAAKRLQAARGWSQWPTCSRSLGLS